MYTERGSAVQTIGKAGIESSYRYPLPPQGSSQADGKATPTQAIPTADMLLTDGCAVTSVRAAVRAGDYASSFTLDSTRRPGHHLPSPFLPLDTNDACITAVAAVVAGPGRRGTATGGVRPVRWNVARPPTAPSSIWPQQRRQGGRSSQPSSAPGGVRGTSNRRVQSPAQQEEPPLVVGRRPDSSSFSSLPVSRDSERHHRWRFLTPEACGPSRPWSAAALRPGTAAAAADSRDGGQSVRLVRLGRLGRHTHAPATAITTTTPATVNSGRGRNPFGIRGNSRGSARSRTAGGTAAGAVIFTPSYEAALQRPATATVGGGGGAFDRTLPSLWGGPLPPHRNDGDLDYCSVKRKRRDVSIPDYSLHTTTTSLTSNRIARQSRSDFSTVAGRKRWLVARQQQREEWVVDALRCYLPPPEDKKEEGVDDGDDDGEEREGGEEVEEEAAGEIAASNKEGGAATAESGGRLALEAAPLPAAAACSRSVSARSHVVIIADDTTTTTTTTTSSNIPGINAMPPPPASQRIYHTTDQQQQRSATESRIKDALDMTDEGILSPAANGNRRNNATASSPSVAGRFAAQMEKVLQQAADQFDYAEGSRDRARLLEISTALKEQQLQRRFPARHPISDAAEAPRYPTTTAAAASSSPSDGKGKKDDARPSPVPLNSSSSRGAGAGSVNPFVHRGSGAMAALLREHDEAVGRVATLEEAIERSSQ